jgi:hypothetical protein
MPTKAHAVCMHTQRRVEQQLVHRSKKNKHITTLKIYSE